MELPSPKFRIDRNGVGEYYVFENETHQFLVPKNSLIKRKKHQDDLFDDKMDALWEIFKMKMQSGQDIGTYRSSKYYEYYRERSKKEGFPEFLF